MKRALPFILIVLVLVISGCVQKNGNVITSNSKALSIIDFKADPNIAESNQDVYLEIGLKNVGDQKAKHVKVRIYNPPFGDCTECWKVRNNNPSCPSLGELWACLNDISPPDRLTGTEGEEKTAYWNLKAPAIPSSSEIPYEFYSRVYYGYETIATTQLVLISRKEAKEIAPTQPKMDNSEGPLKFYAESKSPIIVSKGQDKVRFCISAQNVGKGVVYAENTPVDGIQSEDIDLLHVSIVFGGLDQVIDDDMKINQTYCTSFYPHEVKIKKTVPITITGTYEYYEDTETTATVKAY